MSAVDLISLYSQHIMKSTKEKMLWIAVGGYTINYLIMLMTKFDRNKLGGITELD